jgi:hypothetical protein
MRQIIKISAFALVMIAFTVNTFGQATANATATIVTPISIVKTLDMSFGNIYSAAAGTVILDPAGARTVTGGATLAPGGTITPATFTVSGTANVTYSITLPNAAITLTSGANSMTVGGAAPGLWTSSPTPTGTIGAGGNQTLTVGATLNVGAAQPAGIYNSTAPFTVTVNYN